MAQGAPDLFVVCKKCGSEVSPYITECPYCGTRLRKRAPRIERDGTVAEPKIRRRVAAPRLGRLRPGEIPGIRGEHLGRPWATIALVALSLFGYLLLSITNRGDVAVAGPLHGEWWRVVTSPFLYANVWYELVSVVAIGVFGWLLERRHGPVTVVLLFLAGGAGGAALEAVIDPFPVALGGNGAALALLCAWAVPDLIRRSRREDYEGDLLGTMVIAIVLLLIPLADREASAIAGFAGAALGMVAGLLLSRRRIR
ncbi:MAG: rhomboid family intrarane serine protease [Solirubrobacterales bacterium]|nr:rhomboid family intrarane serine protease [Solirubrobacterales bacterium]